ncbi:hypothetical protein [Microterricola gilva]|nr:hypothetical protein [Microterricola gilva]
MTIDVLVTLWLTDAGAEECEGNGRFGRIGRASWCEAGAQLMQT